MKREKRGGRETSPFFLSVAVKCYVSSFALRDLQIRIRGKRRIQSRVQDVERTERLGVRSFGWLEGGPSLLQFLAKQCRVSFAATPEYTSKRR